MEYDISVFDFVTVLTVFSMLFVTIALGVYIFARFLFKDDE